MINGNPTPTSTRSYNDGSQKVARSYFSIDRILKYIQPSPDEMKTVTRCAVAMSAYKALPGRSSPFPSPFDFFGIGINVNNPPAFEKEKSYRSNWLLRLSSKLNQYLTDQIKTIDHDKVTVTCPECLEDSIVVTIGTLPTVDVTDWTLVPQNGPRMVAVAVECNCQTLNTSHYSYIENLAVSKYCDEL